MTAKAHKYGDHIDTDQIIPAQYLVTTVPRELALHCMETPDPDFVKRVKEGDVMIGGIDFGCGSSREHAPIALMGAGISCVIAKSFARIFFRNSINLGLPVLESPEAADAIEQGDEIDVDLATGTIRNLTTEQVFKAKPFEPFMMDIIKAGGLVEYTKRKLASG